ncbi:molybdopterin molybdotransferase MoeA [Aquibacillus kalidii]|uniref:molybdopterin molybdotransferase MoeA n=1 Tax=Aquibacillus kalidii TaxID=2762597 RepID=UPI0016486999|nr:gephyrin-like molybdotransferase Glp [Aquibacillus kalidii]
MVEVREPISVHEAVKRVLNFAKTGEVESIDIEQSNGRVLGDNLIADHDIPLFDRSPYDGYAIIAEDTIGATKENPLRLDVVAEIGAGHLYEQELSSNQAVRIMTGAQLPEGSNAVIMLEQTETFEENGQTYVDVYKECVVGENISFQGEDITKGTIVAEKGTLIGAGMTALLATFGYKHVPVFKKPIVGVIATGTELLAIDEELVPGKIRNSNTYMLLSQIERAGGQAVYLGQFEDDLELCYQQVKGALEQVDMVITTGGVSVGDFDYLPAIYEKLTANVLFNKIAMRPGSVTTVAEYNGKLLFGLSGNPSACFVGFEMFTRPVIRQLLHVKHLHLRKEKAVLRDDFPKPNAFTRFVRGYVSIEDGKLIVSRYGLDQSNAVSSLAKANALIVLPGGTDAYSEGTDVEVRLLDDQEGSSELVY